MLESAFSKDYFEARMKFLAAAESLGLEVETRTNPHTSGPGGEPLHTDITTLGDPEAPNRILLISATHGVEGFCGSGCQTALLRSPVPKALPQDVSITFLHALNPHGFAWLRRVNESNIDLNRNFVDFKEPLPDNIHYEALRRVMVLDDLAEETIQDANRQMVSFGKVHGFDTLQEGLTKGQYVDASGLYYGGTAPSWSNDLLRDVLRQRIAGAQRAVQIDFHTGLGPSGYGEIITEYDLADPAFARAKAWLGEDVTSTVGGDSSSAALTGTTDHAFHQELGTIEGVSIALEFGTVASDQVFAATRADNWLHLNQPSSEIADHPIKGEIRDAFYQDDTAWKEMVLARADEVVSRAIAAIGTGRT